jgi:hypothetical protein
MSSSVAPASEVSDVPSSLGRMASDFKARHGGGKGEGAPWGAWGAFTILAALP